MCGVTNDTNTIYDQPHRDATGYQVWNPSVGIYHKAASNKQHSYGGIVGALQDKQVESNLAPKAYPENFAGIIAAIQDLKAGTYEPGSDVGDLPPGDSINNTDPDNPIYVPGPHLDGELWFDTRQGRLFVYINGNWVQTNGADGIPIVSDTQPSGQLVPGQLWYNSLDETLYIFNGQYVDPNTGFITDKYADHLDPIWKLIGGGTPDLQTTATLPLAIASNPIGPAIAYLPDISEGIMQTQKDYNAWLFDSLVALDEAFSDYKPVVVSEDAPDDPVNGQLWYDTQSLDLSIWYDDGDTQQWVPTNASYAVDSAGDAIGILDEKIEAESNARIKVFTDLALQVESLSDTTDYNSLTQEVAAISHRIDVLPEYDLEQYVTKDSLASKINDLQSEIATTASVEPDLSLYETKSDANARQIVITNSLSEKATQDELASVLDLIPDVSDYTTFNDVTNSINNITTEYLPRGGGDLNGSFNLIKDDMSKPGISFGSAANGVNALEFESYSTSAPTKATLGTTSNFWEVAWNFSSLEDFCWVYDNTNKVFSITKDGPACSTLYLGDIQTNTSSGRMINNKIDVKEKLVKYQTVFENIRQGVSGATDFDSLKANILLALESV